VIQESSYVVLSWNCIAGFVVLCGLFSLKASRLFRAFQDLVDFQLLTRRVSSGSVLVAEN